MTTDTKRVDAHVYALSLLPKPRFRGVSHFYALFVAVVAAVVLVVTAPSGLATFAAAVYATTLVGMFGASALYHRGNWSLTTARHLLQLDHTAIFLLIAGTYTPLALALEPGAKQRMLVVAWAGAVLGVGRALFWVNAPKWMVAVLAVALGWLAVLYAAPLAAVAGLAVVVWMGIGGVLYSLGALIYALRRPDPWPQVFGYHELFHSLVIAAAVAHYVAICGALPVIGKP